jgi:hypothetical protein
MKALRLLAAALVLPACGGGGGGGGAPSWTAAFPPLPTAGAGGSTGGGWLAALAPVDTSMPDHTIATAQPNADIVQDLRDALAAGGVIVFDNAGPLTITVSAPLVLPDLGDAVLDGGGTVTLSGGDAVRILEKNWQSQLTVQRLIFRDARSAQSGAAINVTNWDGALTVIDCDFVDCRTTEPGPDRGGGAIRATGQTQFRVSGCTFTDCAGSNGGALNSLGCQLTVIDSVFERNRAFGTGGGADVGSSGGGGIGGAIYVDGVSQNAAAPELSLSGCVFRNNIANDHAGAVFGYTVPGSASISRVEACTFSGNVVSGINAAGENAGAMYSQHGSLTIRNTTFDGNDAPGSGGAIFRVIPEAATLIEGCTFHANHGGAGGALWIGTGTYTIQNCTISGNTASLWGAGIWRGGGTVTVRNTIFASNVGTDTNGNVNGWHINQAVSSGANNIQFPALKGAGPATDVAVAGAVSTADPGLGGLADNGGPTRTRSIPAAGNAENAGTATGAPATDQRGLPRVGAVDIGAFERQ